MLTQGMGLSQVSRCLSFALLVCLLAWSQEAFSATTIGNTSIVVRTVTGTLSEERRDLKYQDDIYRNEIIETFEESATELTFLDETNLSLGPNTKITLDRFVYDADPANSAFVLTITEGALRFATGVLSSDSYEIHTPVATIGIRGTVIDIVVDRTIEDDGTVMTKVSLAVLEGEADLINCDGEKTLVPRGLSSTVEGSVITCSAPSAPGPQSPDVTDILQARDQLLDR